MNMGMPFYRPGEKPGANSSLTAFRKNQLYQYLALRFLVSVTKRQ